MSVTVDEAGGQIVRYSWRRVTWLIELYWVREAFLRGKQLGISAPWEAHGGDGRMRCQLSNGYTQDRIPPLQRTSRLVGRDFLHLLISQRYCRNTISLYWRQKWRHRTDFAFICPKPHALKQMKYV